MYKPRSISGSSLYTAHMIANIGCARLIAPILTRALARMTPLLISGLLVACGSTPTELPTADAEAPVTINKPPPALPATPEQAFDLDALDGVTTIALTQGTLAARIERNRLLARGLDATTLALINSRLAWFDGDISLALRLLDDAATANIEGRALILAERQRIAKQRRQWINAARYAWQRIKLAAAPADETLARQEELFANLVRASDQQLLRARSRAEEIDWRGWIELAIAYRNGRETTVAWVESHQRHPAVEAPPAALNRYITQRAPQKIALLLPLGGRLQQAGEAVLNGVVEGLYALHTDPQKRPDLVTVDTTLQADAVTAYRLAVSAGADAIIGPLTRERVNAAARMDVRSVPQLALNRPDPLMPTEADNWTALSLAPEDEARQLAELAFGDGLRRAVVIRPASDWGRRLESSLVDRWRLLGGQIIATAEIDEQTPASQRVSAVLGAGDSEQRIGAVEDAFAAPVTARARRRGDIDVVFMLAPDPAAARELRPLLVFHYAGDVPVFSPASIYGGNRQSRNQDLNGLIFVETPAVLEAASIDRFTRLRALGTDAIRLIDHWDQVQTSDTATLQGQTGLLTREPNGDVRRELVPTEFDGDDIRQIPLR